MDQANLTSAESDFLTNIDELDLQLLCDTPELDLSNINNDLPSTSASTSQIPDLVNIVNNAMQEGRDTDSPDIQAHLQAVVNELNSQNWNDGSQSPTLIPSQLLNMIAELNNQANSNSGRNSPDIPAQLLHMIQNLNTQPLIDRMTVNPIDHEIDASVITGNMPPSFQPNNCSVIIDHEIDVIDNNAPAFQDIAHQSNNNASVITNQRGGSVVVNRPHFNNIEIRRHLNIPSQANSNDFATFYLQIEDRIDEVLREVDMQTQRGDVIQIELVAGNDRAHVYSQKSDINTVRDNVSDLLERLAQSNVELLADENLELIVEIVKPIRGGMRRRLMNTTNKEILTRDYLGDLTDELSNDSISEFVSAGPKTYAYKTRGTNRTVMKGLPESFDDEKLFPPQQHHLLVLDDIIFQASDNQEVLERLNKPAPTIRDTAEYSLDEEMKQRYMGLIKQRDSEQIPVTIRNEERVVEEGGKAPPKVTDEDWADILDTMGPRYRRSASYVLKKLSAEDGLPESFDDEKLFPPQQHHLLVLDDIIFQASDNQEVNNIDYVQVYYLASGL
ncbi:uncharacterized protein LOC133147006 [Syngnathus typhle]|uniref:uncharacterized protein LOC133147006 n=1 Tax=Syngnathus typhle TaxID=161592 RepID=UPI002A6B7169|nr:uncharacterized protein LOC133147006 [Syngnathus typhle]